MEYLKIEGGRPLSGQVAIQGSKNAVLPMLSAALLHPGKTTLYHCPRIRDVEVMLEVLRCLGCKWEWKEDCLRIDAEYVHTGCVPENLASCMRSSITLLGSLLSRLGYAYIPSPGGCVIGERPIDLHIRGLEALGAACFCSGDGVEATCDEFKGGSISLRFPSVGATENLILAAVLAKGDTCIRGAAREPEIVELCGLLKAMGARISGAGSPCICIHGVKKLCDAEYRVVPDRIVAGTYLCAAAACGGNVHLKDAPVEQLTGVIPVLKDMGMRFTIGPGEIEASMPFRGRGVLGVETGPYPGFPTDLQSPLLAAMCVAKGRSSISENIFEDRFKIVQELNAMGADICVSGKRAYVDGALNLHGGILHAKDLRGGAALCIAAAAAQGESRIYGCEYIFRGYENVIRDLKNLGIVVHLEKS